jgi:hypothetical protein
MNAARLFLLVLSTLLALAAPAIAQQPSQTEIAAVRSSCPADYRANCAGVPPGGQASLACLAKNLASLSPACRKAVSAATGAGAAAGPANPAPTAPAAATETPGAPATSAAPAATPGASAPAPAQAAAPAMPALTPREELAVLRIGCGPDFRMLCAGTPLGGGRILACLAAHRTSLSPQCARAMATLRQ